MDIVAIVKQYIYDNYHKGIELSNIRAYLRNNFGKEVNGLQEDKINEFINIASTQIDYTYLNFKKHIIVSYFTKWNSDQQINNSDFIDIKSRAVSANNISVYEVEKDLTKWLIDNNFITITGQLPKETDNFSFLTTNNFKSNKYQSIYDELEKYLEDKTNTHLSSSYISALLNKIDKQVDKEEVAKNIIEQLIDKQFVPEINIESLSNYEKLTQTDWKGKLIEEEPIEDPIQKEYHEHLSKVAQFIVAKKHASYGLIASYFRELNDYDITNILRQLKELNIISSNDNLLIKNQSDLNRIFQQYKIQYTPFVIPPIVYPPILPLLFQTLTQVFKYNNEDKLLKSDLIKIYSDYKNEHTQDIIESNVYNFIKTNKLVPEDDKIKNEPKKEIHCSTNWIIKEKTPIVFPPPGCGKWLGYLLLAAIISSAIYYGYKEFYSGIIYHTIAIDGANIRSNPDVSSEANIKEKIVYGQTFKIKKETDLVPGFGGMWLKKEGLFSDKSDRYASSKIFVSDKDFYLLESIFGDETTKQAIKTVKCRKALIDYYKRQDPDYKFFGKINDITYKEVYKKPKDFTGEWQVFCEPYINGKPNSVFYEKVTRSNSEFTDFGFIVTNVSANIKRFVLYAFDDITEEPIYVGEADATGHNLVKYVTVRPNGTLNVNFAD